MRSRSEGGALVIELEAPGAASARATLEDLLPCVAAAERTEGVAATRPAPRDPG